ncbi:MAG: PqqD family protein [Desulfobacterales bacterium]|nr:PqqD family protein [Desulfobacterales bacterium]
MKSNMDSVDRRRRNILYLAGLMPGLLLGTPKSLRAGEQQIKPFLQHLEMERMEKLKPERHLSVTCNNEGSGMAVLSMHGKAQPLVAMNRTGKTIWDACNGENTLKDIAAIVSQKYEVSPDQAFFDVFSALRDLRSRGAVRF